MLRCAGPSLPGKVPPTMRAKDDAASQSHAVRSRRPILVRLSIGALFGALLAIGLAPTSLARFEVRLPWSGAALGEADWPHAPGLHESAEVRPGRHGMELLVRAPEAPQAEALARDLVAHQAGAIPSLRSTEAELRASWRAAVPQGPSLPMTRGSEVGALLLAESSLRQDLALQLPGPYAAAPAEQLPVPSVDVLERQQALSLAIPSADPEAVERLLLEAASSEADWIASSSGAGRSAPERGGAWRRWQLARADSFATHASHLLGPESALQRSLADWRMPAARARLGDARASSYLALARAQLPPRVPPAAPIGSVWAMLAGLGACSGAAAAAVASLLAGRGRRTRRAPAALVSRDPAATGAWLHVVSGPDRHAIARAALELASHSLARRERVLLVDAGRRLALHERLGREARWGLMECLHCDMPVLGLVQYGGWPGLYLLAHGEADRAPGWSDLGRRLDEARPHFARVLVCVERTAPGELGASLMGRTLEGWWAASAERLPRAAAELSGRIGIAFSGIDMRHFPDVSLERLGARARMLAPAVSAAPEPVREARPRVLPPPAEPTRAVPVVLDCDLQVQHRLRFLAWMRRVQSESRHEELEPVG